MASVSASDHRSNKFMYHFPQQVGHLCSLLTDSADTTLFAQLFHIATTLFETS